MRGSVSDRDKFLLEKFAHDPRSENVSCGGEVGYQKKIDKDKFLPEI